VPGQQHRQVRGAVEHHRRQRVEDVGKDDVEEAAPVVTAEVDSDLQKYVDGVDEEETDEQPL